MLKVVQLSILIPFIFMVGCSGLSKYDDNEAAAIVKGQEITVGDLRFLYPDDTALDSYTEKTFDQVKQNIYYP